MDPSLLGGCRRLTGQVLPGTSLTEDKLPDRPRPPTSVSTHHIPSQATPLALCTSASADLSL